ncbi:hypothetical protein QSH57_006597 [Fusarium oxysporum f. sp. vasinfectum]|nr:hypothetical protein QSH57_006597 [Fusarium oxysporum f. sp. vasinfectum]
MINPEVAVQLHFSGRRISAVTVSNPAKTLEDHLKSDRRCDDRYVIHAVHHDKASENPSSGAKTRASKILTPKSRGKKQADPKPDPKSTKSSKTPITSRKPTRDESLCSSVSTGVLVVLQQIEDWSTGEVPETVKAGKRKLQEGFTTATKIKKPQVKARTRQAKGEAEAKSGDYDNDTNMEQKKK